MNKLHAVTLTVFLAAGTTFASAQSRTVILNEPGLPAVDSQPVSRTTLESAFPGADFVSADQLETSLSSASDHLLVLPYGSAYPEESWPAILRYLENGGNLLVLGGRPFTRAAFKSPGGRQLRPPSVAVSLELFIADYQSTPGSASLSFATNSDVSPAVPTFAWSQAFSPIIRLSAAQIDPTEIGGSGSKDAALTALAWGVRDGHKVAAPLLLIDHIQHRFAGGRWILLACTPAAGALEDSKFLAALGALALRRGDRFTVQPSEPLLLAGERGELGFHPADRAAIVAGDQLDVVVSSDQGRVAHLNVTPDPDKPISLPKEAAEGVGLRCVDATLLRDGMPVWSAHTGFWLRDSDALNSGPVLGVGPDYFTLDGKSVPIVGTTYMASDTDRLYLSEPNPAVWDRDMAQIQATGINMIRTGMWSGWAKLTQADGAFTDHALRAVEAFLLTARKHNLAVQFNLFAFLPLGPVDRNPYLDHTALAVQDRYVQSLAKPFAHVPFLAWDLINEPSANHNIWKTVPEDDPEEDGAWRTWIKSRYPDQAALLAAWAEPSLGVGRALQFKPTNAPLKSSAQDPLAMPTALAFQTDGVRDGGNPLKVYDYFLFTQSYFSDWAARQRNTIRATGSQQLITIGQDEGGTYGRVSPAFFLPQVDFTSIHTWWDFDAILWASLAAKLPGKPMLVQEMGEQRRLMQDDQMRFTAKQEARQLERKLSLSFVQGAGGIEWVWNVNALMANGNETTIGAVRPDLTEKPEAEVLSGIAQFARQSPASFTVIEPPQITIVTSQSLLYSGMSDLALAAQKKALRALCYYDHMPARMLPENQLAKLGSPRLVILPAAQALTDTAWQQLLDYVAAGGHLLISGSVSRDEHWQPVDRLTPLGILANTMALAVRQSTLRLPLQSQSLEVTYPFAVQQAPLEVLRFPNGESVQEIPHGQGTILWAADPVEFAENYEPTVQLYGYAIQHLGIAAPFRQLQPLSSAVLAFPTVLKDAILYSFSSESLDDTNVDIEDGLTKARIHFSLGSARGALLLLRRSDGKILASYGTDPSNRPPL